MRQTLTCQLPDKDFPKMKCGYPLPCKYHTVIIDMSQETPTVNIPVTAKVRIKTINRLRQIARALKDK